MLPGFCAAVRRGVRTQWVQDQALPCVLTLAAQLQGGLYVYRRHQLATRMDTCSHFPDAHPIPSPRLPVWLLQVATRKGAPQ